jgi:aldose 1-epimerase
VLLDNDQLRLTFLPEHGCHWLRLEGQIGSRWIDLLVPAGEGGKVPEHGARGSFLLAPWSNRIAGGAFVFAGEVHRLRQNFPDGTAIHGDVRSRPWRVTAAGRDRFEAALETRDFPDFNYPFALAFRHELTLAGAALRVTLRIENRDRVRAPVGFGYHPYFPRRLTESDADVALEVPAGQVYPAQACLPVGPAIPVSGANDLRAGGLLGSRGLDHCFTDLAGDTIQLAYAGSGVGLRLRLDPVFTHAVVFAPDEAPGRPKDFVAVEPVTMANDGFNLLARGYPGTGVKVLVPGEEWGASWELAFEA